MWTDGDVAKTFSQSTKAQQVAIRAAIERKTDQLFHQARQAGRRKPRETYAMDAFEAICKEWLEAQDHTCDRGDTPAKSNGRQAPIAIARLDYEVLLTNKVSDG